MQSYQLKIKLNKKIKLQIGKLGEFLLKKGIYIYTGSAKKNIDARIKRHLCNNKKLHWHIDYLLLNKNVKVIDVNKSNKFECDLNNETDGKIIIHGFGSSDSKAGCKSHLKFKIL
jgi:Uri superfamily endonuclease